jgi:phosphoglycerate dehydrogenase-like enzyme
MKTNVLMVFAPGFKFTDGQLAALRKDFPCCEFTVSDNDTLTDRQLERAEVMVGFPKPEVLKKATNLKWLHLSSIGVDKHADPAIYANSAVMLSNSSGTYGRPIAEHIVGLMIALSRNFTFFFRNQERNHWEKKDANKDLYGSTVLIVGLGDVGRQVAMHLRGFGMHVIAVKRTLCEKPSYVDELFTTQDLDALLPKADYVILCLAATPETIGIMDRRRLMLMRKDAYIINIGRGSLVDQDALCEVLENRDIAGAAIDVMTPEPLPSESPLWRLDNLIITPHCSGKSPTTNLRQFQIFHDELQRYVEGNPPKNLIDFNLKY